MERVRRATVLGRPIEDDTLVERGADIMARGRYEIPIREALKEQGAGPWDIRDLDRLKGELTQQFCSRFGEDCDKSAVLDWLSALPPKRSRTCSIVSTRTGLPQSRASLPDGDGSHRSWE